jgi:sodium-dependent phosphate transporter
VQLLVPLFFFITLFIIGFFIFYKGSPALKKLKLSAGEVTGISAGMGAVAAIAGYLTVRFYVVPNIERTPELNKEYGRVADTVSQSFEIGYSNSHSEAKESEVQKDPPANEVTEAKVAVQNPADVEMQLLEFGSPAGAAQPTKPVKVRAYLRGMKEDVVHIDDVLVKAIHDQTEIFDGKTERVFTPLQVLSSCAASFAHGANDLANALAPFASCVYIYTNGFVSVKEVEIPFWQIAYCAISLDLGLLLYGYKIMRTLGNELCLQSPSRGFCVTLSSMLTVLVR